MLHFLICFVGLLCVIAGTDTQHLEEIEIVTRSEWGAHPPSSVENLTIPAPFVVIHHSYIPAACYTKEKCMGAMREMQKYHQFNHSWPDIGYQFAVGSDDRVYEGRGWTVVGTHAPPYNHRSIGICIIGDYQVKLPAESQLEVVKKLIKIGVQKGYIQENYKLIGHRQATATECPGGALYQEIQTWPHWISNPKTLYP